MDNLSYLSTHYPEAKFSVRSSRAKCENELILTAASNVQKYRIGSVLPQLEDAGIRRYLGDSELRECERPNARIRAGLDTKHNVTVPCRFYPISAGTTAYLVGILLNLDNMLSQLLRILDTRFRFEECFFLRIQYQQSLVEGNSTEACFGFKVNAHGCRLAGLWISWGTWLEASIELLENGVYITTL
jgi:hypothetical protein